MKKKLNTNAIANELRGSSAFFPGYEKQTPTVLPKRKAVTKPKPPAVPVPPARVVPPEPLVPPVPVVLPDPPAKRVMKQRHPFDIYRDQYEALQQLALEERTQGGIGCMSAMVREAIDKLIAERRAKR